MTIPQLLQYFSATSISRKTKYQFTSQYQERERVYQVTHFQSEQLARQSKDIAQTLEAKAKQRNGGGLFKSMSTFGLSDVRKEEAKLTHKAQERHPSTIQKAMSAHQNAHRHI